MAEALLADVAATTLTTLLSAAADPLIRAWGLEDDLDNLKQKMRLAQGLISDTMGTTSTVTRSVAGQRWLEQLTDMVRDAENMMAEVDYNLLRQKIKRRNKVHAKLSSTLRSSRLSPKIQKISVSFDELLKRGNEIGLKPLEHLHPNKTPVRISQTPPTVDESEIVGRDGDVCQLVQRLCSCCSSNDLSVLAVVGSGGLGKTTLARLVLKNEQIVKHFGVRIWVTVSDQFDTLRILNDMLQSLTQQNHALTTIPPLIQKLKDSLGGNKRFLLVLDDVWNKHFGEWDNLRSSLMGMKCVGDNKILITTRDTEVASTMGSCFNQPLPILSAAESWTLFRQKAFAEGGAEETEALRAIGERLVRRCGGLPLALRVLGGLMYSRKSESEWLSIENNPLWSTNAEVMPSLRISFDHLESSALKCCFAFCSIFPKDSVLGKDMLAQCWMASGFLDDSEGVDMEDKAEVYLKRLVWSSLFHMSKDPQGSNACEMHDLVHDLAIDVSKKYCASQGGSAAPNSIDKAIHVSLIYSTEDELKFSKLNFKRLQTLYLNRVVLDGEIYRRPKSCCIEWEILGNLKQLRILVLNNSLLSKLPKSIGDLKQLRYLDISGTYIWRLPDSITKLYSLQTLRVKYLEELPKQFGNLISLRYFWAKKPEQCRNWLFIGVGRATGLRTLSCFAVDESKGCRLADLGSLDKLSGELSIFNLKGVSGIEAAKKANLCRKPNIHALSYEWEKSKNRYEWGYAKKGDKSRHNDEGVLEGLQPHSNLKELEIRDFKGRRLASWMTRVDESSKVLQHLVKITLFSCHHCEEIPSLGHLPHLEYVRIHEFRSLKRIGSEFYGRDSSTSNSGGGGSVREETRVLFPSLKVLRLVKCGELEEWWEWSEAGGVGMQHLVFPRLEELRIEQCRKLVVPGHFPTFQELVVIGRRIVADEDYFREASELQLKSFIIVADEEIVDCRHLVSLPDLGRLTELKRLTMGGFSKDLDEFPWPNSLPASCSELTLFGWEKLKTLPHQIQHLSASLTQLDIVKFDGLESLPEWLANLSNLDKLTLFDCRNLKSLPSVEAMQRLHRLNFLHIGYCPLLEERCREGSGPEWPKICNLLWVTFDPYICINQFFPPSFQALTLSPSSSFSVSSYPSTPESENGIFSEAKTI